MTADVAGPLVPTSQLRKATLVGRSEEDFAVDEDEADSSDSGSTSEPAPNHAPRKRQSSLFKSVQWSPDGTSLVASRGNNTLGCYILPPELLSGSEPYALRPYASYILPSPVYATTFYPGYRLSEPSSTLFLASPASLPIRLLSPFSTGILASYPLINATTEAYIAPHSLHFAGKGRRTDYFLAGSDCQISSFDISRDGEGPIEVFRTIPSRRKKIVGGGVGMKGIVSTMDSSCEGILAAGTFTRWIGLYDGEGRGGNVGLFQLGKNLDDPPDVGEGKGITQVMWSSCGRYLCTAERFSGGIGVWDIRGTGKRLAWLSGRKGMTMQRLGIDIVNDDVWAGGTDGKVRVWKGLGTKEAILDCDWEIQGHNDAISSATMHPCGTVLASCSGQWPISGGLSSEDSPSSRGQSNNQGSRSSDCADDDRSSRGSCEKTEEIGPDNSLKIWSLRDKISLMSAAMINAKQCSVGEFGVSTALKSIKSLVPLLDRILVQRVKAESKTASGIFLPESSVKELNEAKVLAIGPGALDKDGKRITPSVDVGDRVLIPQYGGSPVKVGEEEYSLFRDHELLAKIRE